MFTIETMSLARLNGQSIDAPDELIECIGTLGVVHPIIVNSSTGRVLDGRKRLGAAVVLGHTEIRAVCWHGFTSAPRPDFSDTNVIERAVGVRFAAMQKFSNHAICAWLGVADTHAKAPSRLKRVLTLDLRVQALIAAGRVSPSEDSIRALAQTHLDDQHDFAQRIIVDGVKVRDMPHLSDEMKLKRLSARAAHHVPAFLMAFPDAVEPFNVEPHEAEQVVVTICQSCDFRPAWRLKDKRGIGVCKACPVARGVKKRVEAGLFTIAPDNQMEMTT